MSDYTKLLEFNRPQYVKDLNVSREIEQGVVKVWLRLSSEESLHLVGFDDLAESISNLIQAERAIISKENSSGKEYGTIRIECWVEESYSEFFCDSAYQTNSTSFV
ncbi:hypothetical protein FLL45_14670 [Aliikangiella marina]|uniref:Uncharacterized protein n=1 Tax=Aliikangiella marina TaxID=1712262 RepID=A0A545TA69_9GAMM|nr:hypothetical protein [Aliikangiella marina]TQV74097.1 hypothetical protein FLL45_14670 [Aliikangiella marina]